MTSPQYYFNSLDIAAQEEVVAAEEASLPTSTLTSTQQRPLVDYSSSSSEEEEEEEKELKTGGEKEKQGCFEVQWGAGVQTRRQIRKEEEEQRQRQLAPQQHLNEEKPPQPPPSSLQRQLPIFQRDVEEGRVVLPAATVIPTVVPEAIVDDDVPHPQASTTADEEGFQLPPTTVDDHDPQLQQSTIDDEKREEEQPPSLEHRSGDNHQDDETDDVEYFVVRPSATKVFKRYAGQSFSFTPVGHQSSSIDYSTQLDQLKTAISKFVRREVSVRYSHGAKVHVSATARFHVIRDGEIVDRPTFHFSVKSQLILEIHEVSTVIADIVRILQEQIADRKARGSNYVFNTITDAQLSIHRYSPNRGGFFRSLPIGISKKRAVLNINTSGDELAERQCILYSIVAHLYPVTKNRTRASAYRANLSKINYEGVNFPAGRREIDQLEKLNPQLSLNVFSFEIVPYAERNQQEKRKRQNDIYQFFPWKLSQNRNPNAEAIDLLLVQSPELLEDDGQRARRCGGAEESLTKISKRQVQNHIHHFCLITDLGRLTRAAYTKSQRITKTCR